MKRPCLSCGRLVANATRCPSCTRAKQRRRDAIRGTPAQRGYDATYRANRAAVLASGAPCVYCGRPAGTVDHRLALTDGGTNDLHNLVPCCSACNSSRGAKLGNARRWR